MSFPDNFKDKTIALGKNSPGVIALTLWTFLKGAAEMGWDDAEEPYWKDIEEPKVTDKKIDPIIVESLGALAPDGCYFGIDDDGNYTFMSADGFGTNEDN